MRTSVTAAEGQDSKKMIEKKEHAGRSLPQTLDSERPLSRSELLLLLGRLHDELDAFFEDIRAIPQATSRIKARSRRPAFFEHSFSR